ncbi:SEC-C domain-containing protein [Kribbella alba]|uniref:YecA family protein n=1 Tax=Kribbella alba TaxID=190197 RepID=UPI0031D3820C
MKGLTTDELRKHSHSIDERLSGLLDAAQHHLLDKQPGQAIAIWRQLIAGGGSDADWGHIEYADYLFREGKEDEARAELAAVMAGGRVFGMPWRLTAELLEELGFLADALVWYSAATRRLTAEELAIPLGPPWAREIRAGQRRVKWRMGMRLDDTDLLVEIGDFEADEKLLHVLSLLQRPEVIHGRLQFWARTEFEYPHALCARHFAANPLERYYQAAEDALRAHAGRLLVSPRTVESLASVLGAALHAKHLTEVRSVASRYDDGTGVEWPPGRNQPCWCRSGTKYKKCCGANRAAEDSGSG